MKNKNVFESFEHAFEGLSHVMWSQGHVRIQLMMVVLVLTLCFVMKLDVLKVLFILSAVALVLMAELFNTAVEVVVNMITETYHPLAKIAKDVAAAGVLIASMYALLVGGAIFLNFERLKNVFKTPFTPGSVQGPNPLLVVLFCFGVMSILVVLAKIRKSHGSILRGGAVSGHSAVAFMLFAAIFFYSRQNILISLMALFLAILVAQSRIEGKIHTLSETLWGAVLALVLFSALVFLTR